MDALPTPKTHRVLAGAVVIAVWFVIPAGVDVAFAALDEAQGEGSPRTASGAEDRVPGVPPGVDNPSINDMASGSAWYADFTFASNRDLSTLPWVQGSGENYRIGLGGRFQTGPVRWDAELSFQRTELTIQGMMGSEPRPEDKKKASLALGDTTVGATWVTRLAAEGDFALDGGFALRARLPSHTTRFAFTAIGGGQVSFGFPYYFHLAPTALLSVRKGPVGLITNQALLAMLARDTRIDTVYVVLPNVFFWESHVAVWVEPVRWLALSAELLSLVQLNRVDEPNFEPLNGVRAVYVLPALTLRVDDAWWIAVAGRIGANKDARDFGVISFSGTSSVMARIGRSW